MTFGLNYVLEKILIGYIYIYNVDIYQYRLCIVYPCFQNRSENLECGVWCRNEWVIFE